MSNTIKGCLNTMRHTRTRQLSLIHLLIAVNCLLVLSFICLSYSLLSELKNPNSILPQNTAVLQTHRADLSLRSGLPARKPLSHYLNKVSRKAVFRIYEPPKRTIIEAKKEEPPKELVEKKPGLRELMGGVTLNGIIAGGTMQAVLVDSGRGKTYFLGEGDIINDARVTHITKEKVVLSYGEEVLELR